MPDTVPLERALGGIPQISRRQDDFDLLFCRAKKILARVDSRLSPTTSQ